MFRVFLACALASATLCTGAAHAAPAYIFSYFLDNGQDGLHLAGSRDGLTWTPLNGGKPLMAPELGDKLVRDPCIILGADGLYHMVWTISWNLQGIGHATSRDLVTWSAQQYIPVMEHESGARNCWAPELFYDAAAQDYLIFWATTIPGRFPTSDGEGDDKYNHRMYMTRTKDFVSFTPSALYYDHGFNVIDATITSWDKRFLMILKDERLKPVQKNLRAATAVHPGGPWSPPSAPITGDYWAEGPTTLRVGEWCYVYFDKYQINTYGAVRTRDAEQWEDVSHTVRFPKGVRHGTALAVPEAILKALEELGNHDAH
ncbi:MAG: glycoside hydrolase family 43 protein [Candidatus Hydrogenedentes bacterium]|nr:glycoside hydrolase family 43 protein [Candidatus Hydrogenedentota bacterium]